MIDGENRGKKVEDKQYKSYLNAEVKIPLKKGSKIILFPRSRHANWTGETSIKVEEFS